MLTFLFLNLPLSNTHAFFCYRSVRSFAFALGWHRQFLSSERQGYSGGDGDINNICFLFIVIRIVGKLWCVTYFSAYRQPFDASSRRLYMWLVRARQEATCSERRRRRGERRAKRDSQLREPKSPFFPLPIRNARIQICGVLANAR